LLCNNTGCKTPITIARLHQPRAFPTAAVIEVQQRLRIETLRNAAVQAALADQETRIRAELARLEAIRDEDERAAAKLRRKIIDDILTLRCPRCQAAFIDFDGCCALTCDNATCSAGFCAWCLTDCGADAHRHVANCPENKSGGVWGTKQQVDGHHKQRKITAMRKAILDADLSKKSREMLATMLEPDLRDLGIQAAEVFPAENAN
jgi:hypothetical protein